MMRITSKTGRTTQASRTITTAAILIAVASLAGCGNKPKPVAPEGDTSETGITNTDPVTNETSTTTPDAETPPTAPSASLTDVIYFQFDASELDDSARTTLNENAEWLRQDAARTLTIEGHTDEVGTTEYNLGLGERRARATKDYLVRLGVEEARVKIITYGEERPAGSDDAKNRRSMFIATQK